MGENRKFTYNVIGSLIAYVLSLSISFFLSPYIIRSLGTAAYGFIGLSNTIISYTGLITVALNAMAGRFVSISYLKGDVKSANQYYSSVFYSNCLLGLFIAFLAIIFVVFIDKILSVPANILNDVRALFSLLVMSSIIGLLTNMFGISMFITNKLYLSSMRQIIGNILGSSIIAISFLLFRPHIWYIGINSVFVVLYSAFVNKKLHNKLTPDLRINFNFFDFKKVKELISAGSWNVINKISDILGQGMALLFANVFVGAVPMGKLSISKTLTTLCLGLFGSISGNYGPNFTKLYAEEKFQELNNEFKKSIKILSCFSTPLLCATVLCCENFYYLWLPNQDSVFLQKLTILGLIASIFSFPLQALWNIFTITNKLKYTSLSLLLESILSFSTIIIGMQFIQNQDNRLILIVVSLSCWGLVRNMTLLPLYGAYCLKQKIFYFYPTELRTLLSLTISMILNYTLLSMIDLPYTWFSLIFKVIIICIISFYVNIEIVLNTEEKKILYDFLKSKIHI